MWRVAGGGAADGSLQTGQVLGAYPRGLCFCRPPEDSIRGFPSVLPCACVVAVEGKPRMVL